MAEPRPGTVKRLVWHVLLFLPFFTAICVPLYNRIEPSLFGIPFFYWFQFLLIIIAAAVTGAAYKARV